MRFIATLFIAIFMMSPAFSQERYATLDVFPSQTAVEKGQSIDIAVRQNIVDEWHTYWFNPGDSGEPLKIDWDLPEGVTVSDITYPTPERIAYDPLINFGHEGQPIYTQTLSISDDFQGDEITLTGSAFWLICKDICIPEEQALSLSIPVGEGINANNDVFEQAKLQTPQKVSWDANLSKLGQQTILDINVPSSLINQFTDVELYPYDWGITTTTSRVISDIDEETGTVTLTADAADRNFADITDNRFVIKTDNLAFEVMANIDAIAPSSSTDGDVSYLFVLISALIGGLILNLMPCVFPVLSMKALSLVQLSDKEKSHARASGLAYTAGIIISFIIVAGALIALKGAGESIGWGFQLQNPYVVAGLATMLFLIGLNLLGLFEINGNFTNVGSGLVKGNDVKSSFYTGVLATLVATPCTAPFMATAIGYALTQGVFISLTVFATLGLGLALPYLLLTFIPQFQKILPRPGAWMNTFKQALAWPMFASVIWLVWVLVQQSGDMGVLYILGLFVGIGFVLWICSKISSGLLKKLILVAFIIGAVSLSSLLRPIQMSDHVSFENSQQLEQILSDNPDQPVFVNMTAAWCITCLVNEKTSLSQDSVKEEFQNSNVIYVKGDWTNRDSNITEFLESYGRNGVPLYVFYGAQDNGERPDPILLPQILTPEIVINTVKGDIE